MLPPVSDAPGDAARGAPAPWYAPGLRFACTRCGECCTSRGEHAYVYVTTREVEALAAHLGLAPDEVRARFCEDDGGWTVLRMDEPECPFLGEDRRCRVYPVRPVQCRTWPFWEDNLKDERRWSLARRTCPGIGRGPLHPAERIAAVARRNEEWAEADGDDGPVPEVT